MKNNNNINKKDNTKLINALFLVGIGLLILSLIIMFTDNKKNYIEEINFNQYKEILAKDKYSIILLTSPKCKHCNNYKPYVNYVAGENNLVVYDLSINDVSYEEYVELHDKYSVLKDEYAEDKAPVIPTPVTVIVRNGEEVASILGNIGSEGFTKLLRNNGVIE